MNTMHNQTMQDTSNKITETVDGLHFRKSSYTGVNNNCVEVADLPCGAAVRDSKHPDRGHLPFPAAEWDAFLTAARLPRA